MRRILLALIVAAFASGAQAQNYNATPGSGLVFGSKLVSSVNYPQIVFCDPATPSQCVAVNASGQITITNSSFTANAGTNLNTSLLALETGGNLAQVVTDFGSPGATACTTDTASCNLNQQMQRLAQRLTTLNTTLGSPFQAGASIGNISFAATQATAANLNATVVGTGTFPVQATLQASATTAIGKVDPNTLGSWGLVASSQNGTTPTNMALMAGQFNTTPTTITSGNVSPFQVDNAGNLLVNIKAGAGSGGTALTDQAAFTQGTTSITPIGCLFISSYSAITTGHAGIASCTNTGALNVQVTNTNVNGSATSANSAPVVIASDQAAVATKAASGAYVAGAIADLAHGSAVSAASVPVVVASDQGAIATKAASASYASGSMVDITNLSGATGSAVPAKAAYAGAVSSGSLTGIIQADASVQINISTATTTQIVALTSGQKIYVTSFDVVAAGTGSFSLVYGTGTNCATGTTTLAGPYSFTAQSGISKGSGLGPVLIVPAGNALCEVNTAAVAMNGSASYTKF